MSTTSLCDVPNEIEGIYLFEFFLIKTGSLAFLTKIQKNAYKQCKQKISYLL